MTRSAVLAGIDPLGGADTDDALLTLSDVHGASERGLPANLPTSSNELLRQSAVAFGDRTAISFFASPDRIEDTRQVSYRDLFAQVTRTANMLHRLGIRAGDVVALLVSLLDHPSEDYDISSLRFATCGAAPLSAEILNRFEEACMTSISEGYGMTETVCDAETDESGVVAIEGPNVFAGYLNPAHNVSIWVDRGDGRRWLDTRDLGRIDAHGYLWLTGRAKDLIIRGGHNIDPSVIEETLYTHRDVAFTAAIGRPDARAGELPVAYVELRKGASTTETELLTFVGEAIAERVAIPKAIMILDKLPLTAVGKLRKPTLRHREMLLVAESKGTGLQTIRTLRENMTLPSAMLKAHACLTGSIWFPHT